MRLWVIAAISFLGAGCSEERLRDVSGMVLYDGQPLPAGVVWFDPAPDHPKRPPQGFAYVKDGHFTTAENGRGIFPGNYTIRVEGFDGKPGEELPLGRPLFTQFREERELDGSPTPLEIHVTRRK